MKENKQPTSLDAALEESVASDKTAPPSVEAPTSSDQLGVTAEDAVAALQAQLADKEAQIAHKTTLIEKSEEAVLRVKAELQTVMRRQEKEMDNLRKYAVEKYVKAILPVKDNLERALDNVTQEEKRLPLYEGVMMTHAVLEKVFTQLGVEEINPMGEAFDADFHEAVSTQKEATLAPNTVVSVLEKGYLLHGSRLVRPARTVVAVKGE